MTRRMLRSSDAVGYRHCSQLDRHLHFCSVEIVRRRRNFRLRRRKRRRRRTESGGSPAEVAGEEQLLLAEIGVEFGDGEVLLGKYMQFKTCTFPTAKGLYRRPISMYRWTCTFPTAKGLYRRPISMYRWTRTLRFHMTPTRYPNLMSVTGSFDSDIPQRPAKKACARP